MFVGALVLVVLIFASLTAQIDFSRLLLRFLEHFVTLGATTGLFSATIKKSISIVVYLVLVSLIFIFIFILVPLFIVLAIWRVIFEDFLRVGTHLRTDASADMLCDFLPIFAIESDSYKKLTNKSR